MSSPTDPEPPATSAGQTSGPTLEIPTTSRELVEVLRHDRQMLVREAILWQRWIRYLGFVALVAMALAFGRHRTAMLLPIGGIAFGYGLFVALTAAMVQRADIVHETRIPALLVTADVLALTALIWLSGGPSDADRLLVPALLVVQLAVFYFGRGLGTYSAVIAGLAYVIIALMIPRHTPGARPAASQVAFTFGLFAVVSAVLVTAYGGFRARMNRLRLFCKLVEEGDLTPALPLLVDKRPDDLTLLARSFDAMRARLAEQIGTDPLTGCLNRRALESRLRAEWRQAKRRGSTVGILAIDLDGFKRVNDTHGHPFGDVVLQEVAGIMKASARDTDAVARLGGDEFVILLPDTGRHGAFTFAERMRRQVEGFAFGAEMGAIAMTISVGVALARGSDPISPEMLLQEADRSLYKAKTAGRNRVVA